MKKLKTLTNIEFLCLELRRLELFNLLSTIIIMLVKEIMTTDVSTIGPKETIHDAAVIMKKTRKRGLVVVDKGKLMGILTEGDIITKVIAEDKTPSKITAESIMTKEVIIIKPDLDVVDAASIMAEKEIKKLPVVAGGKLLGVVTAMDIVESEPEMVKQLSDLFLVAKKRKSMAG